MDRRTFLKSAISTLLLKLLPNFPSPVTLGESPVKKAYPIVETMQRVYAHMRESIDNNRLATENTEWCVVIHPDLYQFMCDMDIVSVVDGIVHLNWDVEPDPEVVKHYEDLLKEQSQ